MKLRAALMAIALLVNLAVPVNAQCSHEFVEKRVESTCEASGVAWLECIYCGYSTDYTQLEPRGHDFGEWYITQEPTCTQEGCQVRDCLLCGSRETASIDKLDHDFQAEVKNPSCTAGGYTRYTCRSCSAYYIADYTDALGHRYDDGVVVEEPTLTTMGTILYTCTGCQKTYQVDIPKLTNPFEDVGKNTYYFQPILWAVYRGITSGMDETHFAPDTICNRAQVVTFLWRAAGKPEPQVLDNPFEDVPTGSFYEQAVLWAYENAITTGTDASHFSPGASCNRAQVVTFLHRFRGCPEPTVTTAFPDVPVGSFYHKAVLWAAQREITVGMDGGNFCPAEPCSRGQIVTFLYRDEKNP